MWLKTEHLLLALWHHFLLDVTGVCLHSLLSNVHHHGGVHWTSSLSLAKTALMLTSIVLVQSISLFATSLFVDLGYMKKILSYFYVSTEDLTPEFIRLVLVVAGTILMVRSFVMFLKSYYLHRQAKERGDTILWSYKEQGL